MNKSVSLIIPLIEHPAIRSSLIKAINAAVSSHGLKEVVFINASGEIPADVRDTLNLNVQVIAAANKYGRTGALKRGLFAATHDVIITIEHPSIDLETVLEQLASVDLKNTCVMGVFDKVNAPSWYITLRDAILGQGLNDQPVAFRIITKDQLLPILGRVYLDNDAFYTEWAHVARKLNVMTTIISCPTPAGLSMSYGQMAWHLSGIRDWHLLPINVQDEHMSDKDVAEMYKYESHHWWFVTKAAFMTRILKSWIPHGKHVILDAGCGTGHNMCYLAAQGSYVGMDVSAQALKFCQSNGHSTLVQGNLDDVPFKTESFDIIFSLDVIEHTRNPWRAIRQLKDKLKPGGHLIVTVPAFRFLFSQHDEALSHFRRYNRRDLKIALEEAGFEIKHLNYLFFFCFIPVALVRIFRKLMPTKSAPSTDMYYEPVSGFNNVMRWVLKREVALFTHVPAPFGTTLLAVAVKK